ncbi:hypothetical protein ACGFX4_38680 [Kitasatospora sp. NPDC048365]|uniref:hypothetical protein n=1 Tax=Kitasatospora sp. NPDC048365 TaxID=3364050 RepID=UPI003719150F
MDPYCASPRDRYRLEPAEAVLDDPARYEREVLRPPADAIARNGGDIRVHLYDFPCSFGTERIDDSVRVMLYGHGKRGTDGPILAFERRDSTPCWEYFAGQPDRMLGLADSDPTPEPRRSKDITVRRYA